MKISKLGIKMYEKDDPLYGASAEARLGVGINQIREEVNKMALLLDNMSPDWIDCSEKLPCEKDGKVLISMPNGEVETGRYSEFSKMWYKGDMCGVGGDDPLAWMPLPNPFIKG